VWNISVCWGKEIICCAYFMMPNATEAIERFVPSRHAVNRSLRHWFIARRTNEHQDFNEIICFSFVKSDLHMIDCRYWDTLHRLTALKQRIGFSLPHHRAPILHSSASKLFILLQFARTLIPLFF